MKNLSKRQKTIIAQETISQKVNFKEKLEKLDEGTIFVAKKQGKTIPNFYLGLLNIIE